MSGHDLGERQGAVLNAVVQEYIRSGEPVGSKVLVGRFHLSVSSATVRNDMSRLEELGYLVQPHTSAGRVPTDLAYRFFVDRVHKPVPLAEGQERALERELGATPPGIDDVLQRASEMLSRYTRQAAAVLAPRLTGARMRHLDLVRLSPRLVLLVIVTDSGRVEKRLVELERDASQTDLDKAQQDLNQALVDKPVADGKHAAAGLAGRTTPRLRTIIEAAATALDEAVRDELRMFVGGTANLASPEGFEEPEMLSRVIDAVERQTPVTRLLAGGLEEPSVVKIGSEVPEEDLQACSVVIASYALGNDPFGAVGVIGPTRMDYTRALAFTSAIARAIQNRLEDLSG